MKSAMPYWGVKTTELQKICKEVFKGNDPENNKDYLDTLLIFFKSATHREEWYAGVKYARKFHRYILEENVPVYLDIVHLTQWWDVVDSVAQNLVGMALLESPNLSSNLQNWIQDDNMWIRRTALLTQMKYKDQTDFNLLKKLFQSTWHEKDFFMRKAIGWALRQYSYTDPQGVEKFITENENDLSPLSFREGMKVIIRKRN